MWNRQGDDGVNGCQISHIADELPQVDCQLDEFYDVDETGLRDPQEVSFDRYTRDIMSLLLHALACRWARGLHSGCLSRNRPESESPRHRST